MLGRPRLVPIVPLKSLDEDLSFDFFQVNSFVGELQVYG
jgi:hypothetical protein